MRLLFILDPLDKLKPYKDTSLAIMREAENRGHALFVALQGDLFLRNERVRIMARGFHFGEAHGGFELEDSREWSPEEFDAILMRKDPPFDNEYLYSTYLLELAARQGGHVFNDPVAIRGWNEKLSIARFSALAPPFLVTSHSELIRDFLAEHGDIVVKPLDGMGGNEVYRLHAEDFNIGVILENMTRHGRRTIMAQRYLPAIRQGDTRIIVIDGKPLPYALARIPKAGETRGNLAAGGKGVAQPLSERDLQIANEVGAELKKLDLFLVGLDVIGDCLTEINVTSPTGMVEIAAQTDCRPAAVFMEALEERIAALAAPKPSS
jgi:glutathione synthase